MRTVMPGVDLCKNTETRCETTAGCRDGGEQLEIFAACRPVTGIIPDTARNRRLDLELEVAD
jgi:hypothetical protein